MESHFLKINTCDSFQKNYDFYLDLDSLMETSHSNYHYMEEIVYKLFHSI